MVLGIYMYQREILSKMKKSNILHQHRFCIAMKMISKLVNSMNAIPTK